MPKIIETDVANLVRDWLLREGWDVYCEVRVGGPGDPIADLVATRGNVEWIVETKTSVGTMVAQQAWNWMRHMRGNYVSVAGPYTSNRYLRHCLSRDGIGYLEVDVINKRVEECIHPAFHRKAIGLDKWLNEGQKQTVPGSQAGAAWTPWKATAIALARYVAQNPGVKISEVFSNIKHHWTSKATATATIRAMLDEKKIPGVRFERRGNSYALYPDSKGLDNP